MDDYPLLNLFWTMLLVFLWVLWFFLLFRVLGDLFRDHEMRGWTKAGWIVLLVLLPYLGVLIYVIVRGDAMGKREAKQAEDAQVAFKQYVRDAAGSSDSGVQQLATLAELKNRGDLSQEEFDRAKAKFLS
ncbi:SHOCT domain-containing protein [Streptomyces sp. CBMA152]|uniref:SHOCT domain-containing protein n=1 Tax=Streptomyces sp. CBMA152 TaxID=1896312 RepID=UPI001660205B|nr:SHOCT domain-containing protein [Streptomyces sp. CBMA152]MBD0741370.1 hypothetical protein [Streptomyces sp. CBMA152]